ncbi:MAG: SCP2 sterol-binding domain-containing protein [Candidatus Caldarchaeales archaeon]
MRSRLLYELKKIIDDVNSDYVLKKVLPSEPLVIELRAEDDGSMYVEISEDRVRILENFDGKPDSTIKGSCNLLTKLLRGEEDPIKSFLLGRVKIEGSFDIAYIIYERLREYNKIKRSKRSP